MAEWHRDFGSLANELEPLRELAILLLERSPRAQIVLENPEAGLIYIGGIIPTGRRFEAYRSSSESLGVFTNPDSPAEGEHYFSSPEAAANFLIDWSNS